MGVAKEPEYMAWLGMVHRCHNPNHKAYKWYGARGISVCDKWRASYRAFYDDMGKRPPGRSLDRIDNDGNYEPGNCRWATAKEQCRNRRNQVVVELDGKQVSVAEASDILGIPEAAIRSRIRSGMDKSKLLRPSSPRAPRLIAFDGLVLTVPEWSTRTGISRNAILRRLLRGWSIKDALTLPMTDGGSRDKSSGRFSNAIRSTT